MGFVGPLRLFYIRAQVRAYLLAVGEYQTFEKTFAPLMIEANESGLLAQLGEPALLAIIDAACRDAGLLKPEAP